MKILCDYCGRRFPREEMTPLYERGRPHVNKYCEKCKPEVERNIRSMPWYDDKNYVFGNLGELGEE